MATVKVKFRNSTVAGKEGTIYFKVTHRRVARQIATSYKLYPSEWDNGKGKVILASVDDFNNHRQAYLTKIQEGIYSTINRIEYVILQLDKKQKPYSADDVVRSYNASSSQNDFIAYAREYTAGLKASGKPVAEHHACALRSFIRYHGEEVIPFADFDSNLMIGYENWMKNKGLCRNTTSCYMRNLHSIYNHAVEDGLAEHGQNPFQHVYTGIDETQKRALSLDCIKKIIDIDLSAKPRLAIARDLFVFSFLTRGMSFVDICYLTARNIKDGTIAYRRRKCGQLITIKVEKPIKGILTRYSDSCKEGYLLPILSTTDAEKSKRQYKSASQRIDNALKKLGEMLKLPIKLTMYVARHSWATAAQSKNIPLATISRCMGHKSEDMTAVYLASIDTSDMDKANEVIMNSLGL